MTNIIQLEGKHILITGGSAGIGKQTAVILSELGAKVALIGRNEERLKQTLSSLSGSEHSTHAIDVTNIELLEPTIIEIVNQTGAFDGFVHCAGIAQNLPVSGFTYERVHGIMQVNFYAFFEITRILSKKGRFNNGMSVVGVSSISATHGARAQSAYGASKAAMDGAVRNLARELGAKGIRINTVQPAATETEMYREYMKLEAATKETDMSMHVSPRQYLGMNAPEDVANAIVFLLSPMSRRITGVAIPVDGGFASC